MRIKFVYLILMTKTITKYFILPGIIMLFSICLSAQMMDNTNKAKVLNPEFRRLINHEAIDREQS